MLVSGDMFERFGRGTRVFLAKDRETGWAKGFAFVSFADRGDAAKACDKMRDGWFRVRAFDSPRQVCEALAVKGLLLRILMGHGIFCFRLFLFCSGGPLGIWETDYKKLGN